jgi:protein phosphatase
MGYRKMNLIIPELSLVLLIGPSGAGKSTFARKHFRPSEVLSSDFCRYLVSDDENDQAATADAFEVLRFIAAKRLAAAKLTVVDATNVQPHARKPLLALAELYNAAPVAIVLNISPDVCLERNGIRTDRTLSPQAIEYQWQELQRSIELLPQEGFRPIYILDEPAQIESVIIVRQS